MSGNWETVGKSKKVKTFEKKLSQAERKKIVENGPKLEEILPSQQIKSIFANVKKVNKENNKPQVNIKVSTPKKVAKTVETQKKKSRQIQHQRQKQRIWKQHYQIFLPWIWSIL